MSVEQVAVHALFARLERIEDALASAAAGEFALRLPVEDLDGADALSAIEHGFNVLFDDFAELRRRDAERARELEQMLELTQEQARRLEDALDTIKSQQRSISELSTPALQLWNDVLAMPIIGVVDTKRSMEIMERLLSEVANRQTRFVILDITGVEVVDTRTADHFIKVAHATRLLGAHCIVSGIRPAVAQTLVEIGVDMGGIHTVATMKDALRECLRRMGRLQAPAAR